MPGRLSARLYLEDVSEPYSKILNKVDSDDKTEVCCVVILICIERVGPDNPTNCGQYITPSVQ